MKKLLLIIGTLVPFLSFSQDGSLDQTFGTNGIALADGSYLAKDVKIQADGKVVACGTKSNADGTDFCIVRFNANGQLDNTFDTDGIAIIDFSGKTDEALNLAIQSDGKIIAAGYTTNLSNDNDIAIIRLNTNGTLDNTFGTGGKVITNISGTSNDRASKVVIQADGKIVMIGSGGADFFNANVIVRYNTDGSLDNTFDTDGKLIGVSFAPVTINTLSDIKILADGKFIISGSSSNQPAIGKLNSDGSFDLTFNTTGKLVINETIFGGNNCLIALQTDGKIVVSYGSAATSELKLLRLEITGTMDASFGTAGKTSVNIGANNDYAMALSALGSGKIIISGSTYANSSNTDFFVARLASNGSLDNTFGTNGITVTSVAPTEGDRAEGMAIQSDGKIIVAGNKCTGSCNYVVLRYNNTGSASALNEYDNAFNFNIYPNPATTTLQLNFAENVSVQNVIVLNSNGQKMKEQTETSSVDVSELSAGLYFVQVTTDKGISIQKFIKN
jgi:uncharacterized delta-60 repeat protein